MLRTALQSLGWMYKVPITLTLKGTILIRSLSVVMKKQIQSRNYLFKQRKLLNVTSVGLKLKFSFSQHSRLWTFRLVWTVPLKNCLTDIQIWFCVTSSFVLSSCSRLVSRGWLLVGGMSGQLLRQHLQNWGGIASCMSTTNMQRNTCNSTGPLLMHFKAVSRSSLSYTQTSNFGLTILG